MKFFVYMLPLLLINVLLGFDSKDAARLHKFESIRSSYMAEPVLQESVQKEYDAQAYKFYGVYLLLNIPYFLKIGFHDHHRLLGYEFIREVIDELQIKHVALPSKKWCLLKIKGVERQVVIAEDVMRNYEAQRLDTIKNPIPLHEFKELVLVKKHIVFILLIQNCVVFIIQMTSHIIHIIKLNDVIIVNWIYPII